MTAHPSRSPEERFVRRALALRAFLRDPALPGLALMVGLVLAGFGAMALGWVGAARTIYVPLQFPGLVSGGIGGLALIGVGTALFDLQLARRDAARERRVTDDLLDEVAELVALAPRIKRRSRSRTLGTRAR
jgi:hypothetical protein